MRKQAKFAAVATILTVMSGLVALVVPSTAWAVSAPSCSTTPVQVLSNANLPSGYEAPGDPDVVDLGTKYLFFTAGKFQPTYTGHDIFVTWTNGSWTSSWATPVLLVPGARVSGNWDGFQMETPHFVSGVDNGQTVHRIYYSARGGSSSTSPWRIGYFQYNGSAWVRRASIPGQPDEPVLGDGYTSMHTFEQSNIGGTTVGFAYEPTVRYHDDGNPATPNWHMWYQAGAQWVNDGYVAYASSTDGRDWTYASRHSMWSSGYTPQTNVYNADVRQANGRWEMALAQTHNRSPISPYPDLPGTGIYWAEATTPSGTAADWSFASQIVPVIAHVDGTWYEKVLSPTFIYSGNSMHAFFHAYDITPTLTVLRIGRVDCTVTP